jgi:uncharacterized protein YraI
MLRPQKLMLVAGFVLLSTGLAAAAPAATTASLKLRAGPGTGFGVLTTMPVGAGVNVLGCGPEGWCRVQFAGFTGYANATYLNMAGPGPVGVPPGAVAVEPGAVAVVPGPVVVPGPYYYGYGPYYGYRYRYGYRRGWRRW